MRNAQIQPISKFLKAVTALASLGFFMNCIYAAPVMAETGVLLEKIVENRDFFISSEARGLNNYDESLLCDISELGADRIGLLLLEPSGFLKSLVFNRNSGVKIHEEATIPGKNLRNELARSGISIADARLVAINIAGFKRIPQEVTPLTPSVVSLLYKTSDTIVSRRKPVYTDKVLAQIHEKILMQDAEIAAMDTSEIISRFRAEIQEAGTAE